MFQLRSRAQPAILTLSTCPNKIIIPFPKSTYNFKSISCASIYVIHPFEKSTYILETISCEWKTDIVLNYNISLTTFKFLYFVGLAYQGKDIAVFRFILEYSSLRDSSP
jgi:hypothetical protein